MCWEKYDNMKEAIKNLKISLLHQTFRSVYHTLLQYCLKYRKNTENQNPSFAKTNKSKLMLVSKCAVGDNINSRCI